MSMQDGQELLLNDAHGVYIPQIFCSQYVLTELARKQWELDDEHGRWAIDTCLKGPQEDDYWDAWDHILTHGRWVEDGKTWELHQDGDLWALCPLVMPQDAYWQFFECDKPDEAYIDMGLVPLWICEDCYMLLAGCEEPDEDAAKFKAVDALCDEYLHVEPDGAEHEFSWEACECCNSSLGGKRYRAVGRPRPVKEEV